VDAHGHAFVELAVVLDGSATHVSAGGSQPLRRGSVVVLRPGEWHGYTDVCAFSVLNIYVGPELFAHELAWVAEDPRLGTVLRPPRGGRNAVAPAAVALDDPGLRRVQDWSTALRRSTDGRTDRTSRVGHLVLVVGEVAAAVVAAEDGRAPARAHPAVVLGARLLREDVAGTWSVERLAASVNASPAYVVRLFTRHLGSPPMAYLNRLRAERAASLLLETDLPVSAIGAMVGWPDPSYASRRFRACFALSPARYRAAFRPG
jgi:AraC family L-rhamnose operon transcriptional activator RhaR